MYYKFYQKMYAFTKVKRIHISSFIPQPLSVLLKKDFAV